MSPQAARDAARFAGTCFFLGVVLATTFLLGRTFGSAADRPRNCKVLLSYQHYTTEVIGRATFYNGVLVCTIDYGGKRI